MACHVVRVVKRANASVYRASLSTDDRKLIKGEASIGVVAVHTVSLNQQGGICQPYLCFLWQRHAGAQGLIFADVGGARQPWLPCAAQHLAALPDRAHLSESCCSIMFSCLCTEDECIHGSLQLCRGSCSCSTGIHMQAATALAE